MRKLIWKLCVLAAVGGLFLSTAVAHAVSVSGAAQQEAAAEAEPYFSADQADGGSDAEEAGGSGSAVDRTAAGPDAADAEDTAAGPDAADAEDTAAGPDAADAENTAAEPDAILILETAEPETETETETESPIDFEELWKTNTDIYAWIRIPGTPVDYPILQSRGENDFYLYHDIAGNDDIYGSIYTQQVNSMDFSDFHTILYGHNMRDDTMFGWLSEYQDLNTLWNHGTIYIYLPDRTLEYWIFAAYVADDMHQLYGVDQTLRSDRQEYLDRIEERCAEVASFDRRLFGKVTADSHILTLSTCYQNEPEHRFLVHAVLLEQPDPGTLPEMTKPVTRPEPEPETETELPGEEELTPEELLASQPE